ncbi:MAG TPA: transketolase, partial [Frankiaceae bacterium]|nr:transketolase [Frankiaceae bacterium]
GDMEEGVTSESSSLAGHQRLGNLVVLYDDNHISIEGNTDVAFSEDVAARYAAYGWHVQDVADSEDVNALRKAFKAAQAETDRPSFIRMRSIIGFPAPHLQNTGKAHGSALGVEEVAATKEVMGLDPKASFSIPDEVVARAREVVDRGRAAHETWETRYQAWRKGNPAGAELLDRLRQKRLPDGWEKHLPTYDADPKGLATRAASGAVLSALADVLPELWGGSADLAGSNNTSMKGALSFEADTADDRGPYGRTLHFGIREHAMGAALNGIALHGGTRPYGGTFLVFSDYMRGAVRLAALMKLPVIYVWTHDSIGLGGDGPTHQPVEHLAALRAIPGLDVVRPADANETVIAWRTTLEQREGPVAMALSRQNVPTIDRTKFAGAEGTAKGAYVLAEASSGMPKVILIATGSEVSLALAARETLEAEGTHTRVVSMPCREWFLAQDQSYQQTVLPPAVKARVSVEAAVSLGWRDFIGDSGETISLEHFGASAPYEIIYEQFGITPERIVAAAHSSLSKVGATHGSTTGN